MWIKIDLLDKFNKIVYNGVDEFIPLSIKRQLLLHRRSDKLKSFRDYDVKFR